MILPLQRGDEHLTEERCFILELRNRDDDPALSIARARVLPGVTTRWHRLRDIAERYVILEGRGEVEVGDLAPQAVAAGDVVVIPPGVRQRIRNSGDIDLVFLALCTPRFRWSAYEDIEAQP
ncbi:MAG: cupin domain-containing protein [Nevskiaceae bacterium]|nr:MAG: cupin domain-containing protein [Nevskiaceae bacterium]